MTSYSAHTEVVTIAELIQGLRSELAVIRAISDEADAAYAAGDLEAMKLVCGKIWRESGLERRVLFGLNALEQRLNREGKL